MRTHTGRTAITPALDKSETAHACAVSSACPSLVHGLFRPLNARAKTELEAEGYAVTVQPWCADKKELGPAAVRARSAHQQLACAVLGVHADVHHASGVDHVQCVCKAG